MSMAPTVELGWRMGDFDANWNVRYISAVKEACGNAVIADAPGCLGGVEFNDMGATTYHDVQLNWRNAFTLEGLKLSVGATAGVPKTVTFSLAAATCSWK